MVSQQQRERAWEILAAVLFGMVGLMLYGYGVILDSWWM